MKIWIIVVTLMCWVDKSNETLFYHFTTTYDVLIKVYKRKIRSLLYKYTFLSIQQNTRPLSQLLLWMFPVFLYLQKLLLIRQRPN